MAKRASDAIVSAMWPPYQRNPHGLSLYCAICRKYEANIQSLKNLERLDREFDKPEQATWLITLLVMFTKLQRLSWKSSAHEWEGCYVNHDRAFFCLRWTTHNRGWRRSSMCVSRKRKLTVHQIPCVVRTRISPWSWLGPKCTARQTQRRPLLAISLRILTRTLNQMRINLL